MLRHRRVTSPGASPPCSYPEVVLAGARYDGGFRRADSRYRFSGGDGGPAFLLPRGAPLGRRERERERTVEGLRRSFGFAGNLTRTEILQSADAVCARGRTAWEGRGGVTMDTGNPARRRRPARARAAY